MIIVKLMGGLGNQMFQYAAGRRLAAVHNTALQLDLGWFSSIEADDTVRKFELAAFDVHAAIASAEEVARFRESRHFARARLVLSKMCAIRQRHVRERSCHFDPEILQLPDDTYLEGFWQSPGYFEDREDIIRKELSVRTPQDAVNKSVAEEISRTEAVSLHVRRGDYVHNPKTHKFHGVCPLEYYLSAVATISGLVKQPRFFVFSDDTAWVKEKLTCIHPATFVDQNGPDNAYEDMRLMSLCKHHIIANSSFSWWGAWLATNPRKVVIAPRRWFQDAKINTNDLIPGKWLRL